MTAPTTVGELLTRDPDAEDVDDEELDLDAAGDVPRPPVDDWEDDADADDARAAGVLTAALAEALEDATAAASTIVPAGKGSGRKRSQHDWRAHFRPIRIDPLPPRGEFDIRAVMDSDYFFD